MANGIKIGNLDISAFKVGSSDCKVYLGDTLLYPTAPPSFQGKWLATYNGGTTASAECGASSAITNGEVTKSNLVALVIGDCVTEIGEDSFNECYALTSLTIGNGVTTLSKKCFRYCNSLTEVVIPDSVTTFGEEAFSNTSSLTAITFGSGVTSIGKGGLSRTGLSNITFPNNVTRFSQYAADSCSNLTGITFGNNVQNIDGEAFAYNSRLASITITTPTPPTIGGRAFGGFWEFSATIYVPSASVNAYKTASGWSDYADHIQAIP